MEIQLTQGQVALIDDEDFEKVSQYKWCACFIPSTKGFRVRSGSTMREGVQVHTVIHDLILPTLEGYTVDHVNRNSLDNRKSNLRPANRTQQCLNQGLRRDAQVPYKGVSYLSRIGKYVATHRVQGKTKHIGLFDSPTDAAIAYDKAVLEYWSQVPDDPISGNYIQFLYLNFPEG